MICRDTGKSFVVAGKEAMSATMPARDEVTQTDVFRRMTPEQRLTVAANLTWQAREWMAAVLRSQKPGLSEAQVQSIVRERFLHGTTD